ncbi:MAG: class I SAM-dependent methyltransferase [Thermomicrobiales bacterium]
MTFDPTLPTIRDRIRSIVGDINEPPTMPDATYDAVIAEYAATSWKLAAADMAERVAVLIEQDPTSYTDVGVMAVGWGDRTRSLRALALRLRSEVASESTTIPAATSRQLARAGASSEPEYRPSRRWRRW